MATPFDMAEFFKKQFGKSTDTSNLLPEYVPKFNPEAFVSNTFGAAPAPMGGTFGTSVTPTAAYEGLPIAESVATPGKSWGDFLFGSVNKDGTQMGALAPMAQGVNALGSLWLGMKQYGIAKDSLEFQKTKYAQDYAAQRGLTNSQLEDRQKMRVREDPNAMQVAEYMAKYGVK